MLSVLAVNAAVTAGFFLVTGIIATRIKDASIIDTCWGLAFVIIGWSTYLQTDSTLVLPVLTTLWGGRLAIYLFRRWRREGADKRYKKMKIANAFVSQAALVLIVALPIELGQYYDNAFGAAASIGLALVLLGYFFEWTGDFQLARFKADPSNKGHVMDQGLWRYTRHPNYFGDFCVWWGLFLISGAPAAIIGPIVMSVLLMKVSGVGLLERQLHKTKPKYKAYTERTSAFFPRPPKAVS